LTARCPCSRLLKGRELSYFGDADKATFRRRLHFRWSGGEERDEVSGTGWADLREDGCLKGEIVYNNGDETTFIATPWPFSAAC